MEFERCIGCPGGECPAKAFFDSVQKGDVPPGTLFRGRAPGDTGLFIKRVTDDEIDLACPGVACGIGDRATIFIL